MDQQEAGAHSPAGRFASRSRYSRRNHGPSRRFTGAMVRAVSIVTTASAREIFTDWTPRMAGLPTVRAKVLSAMA